MSLISDVAASLRALKAPRWLPALLTAPWRIWMAVALTLGWVVSRVVLVALFMLALTPIALVARLAGKRFLNVHPDRSAQTYWVPHDQRSRYEKMY